MLEKVDGGENMGRENKIEGKNRGVCFIRNDTNKYSVKYSTWAIYRLICSRHFVCKKNGI